MNDMKQMASILGDITDDTIASEETVSESQNKPERRRNERNRRKTVDITDLIENPYNEFTIKDDEEYAQLYALIRNKGQTEELMVVEQEDGKYRILSGHRRFKIFKELGINKVRVEILPTFESILSEKMFIAEANLGKRIVTAYDMAATFKSMEHDLPENFEPKDRQDFFMKSLGISRTSYFTYQKLATLPTELIEYGKFNILTNNEGKTIAECSPEIQQILIAKLDSLKAQDEPLINLQKVVKEFVAQKDKEARINKEEELQKKIKEEKENKEKKSTNFNSFLKKTNKLISSFDFENLKLPNSSSKKDIALENVNEMIEKLEKIKEELKER